jgi:hypothetical protein
VLCRPSSRFLCNRSSGHRLDEIRAAGIVVDALSRRLIPQLLLGSNFTTISNTSQFANVPLPAGERKTASLVAATRSVRSKTAYQVLLAAPEDYQRRSFPHSLGLAAVTGSTFLPEQLCARSPICLASGEWVPAFCRRGRYPLQQVSCRSPECYERGSNGRRCE